MIENAQAYIACAFSIYKVIYSTIAFPNGIPSINV